MRSRNIFSKVMEYLRSPKNIPHLIIYLIVFFAVSYFYTFKISLLMLLFVASLIIIPDSILQFYLFFIYSKKINCYIFLNFLILLSIVILDFYLFDIILVGIIGFLSLIIIIIGSITRSNTG